MREALGEGFAREEFHDEEEAPVVLAALEEAHDAGMVELTHGLGLPPQAFGEGPIAR